MATNGLDQAAARRRYVRGAAERSRRARQPVTFTVPVPVQALSEEQVTRFVSGICNLTAHKDGTTSVRHNSYEVARRVTAALAEAGIMAVPTRE